MKKIILILLIMTCRFIAMAQTGYTQQWLTVLDSTTSSVDQILEFSSPAGGCSVITGEYSKTPQIALSNSGNQVACIGMSNCNIFTGVLKTSDGSNSFQDIYTGYAPSNGYGVAYDKNDNLFSLGASNVIPGGTNTGIFLRKYNTAGTVQFTNTVHYARDNAPGMRIDTNGKVLLQEISFNGSQNVDPLYCFDNSGVLQWLDTITTSDAIYGYATYMDIDNSGNTIFTGKYQSSGSPSSYEVVIRKVSPSGVQLWQVFYNNMPACYANSIKTDNNGDIYMLRSGISSNERLVKFSGIDGSLLFDIDLGAQDFLDLVNLSSSGNVVLMRPTQLLYIDYATGSTIWTKSITNGYSLNTDGNGRIYPVSTDSVRIYDTTGSLLNTIGVSIPGYTARLESVTADQSGNSFYLLGERSTATTNKIFVAKFSNCSLPSAGTITGATSVIAGNTTTLTDTATGGIWSSSNTAIATIGSTDIVTGVSAGVDTIQYTVTNGCGSATATQTVTVSASTLPCYVPSSGLVAWYPFTGNTIDSSGNGNNGTNYGAILTTDRFGNPNSAYHFDGISSYIACGYNSLPAGNSPRTISFWIESDTYPVNNSYNNHCGVSYGTAAANSDNELFYYRTTSNVDKIRYAGYDDDLEISISYDTMKWYFITATFDGNNAQVYINDSAMGSGSFTSWNTVLDSVLIGTNPDRFFRHQGKIDDIGIWNRVLTQCEISKLYYASCIIPAGAITGPSSVSTGSSITLTESITGGMWSSSNTSVATAGSTGIVIGVAVGTATISYTITNSCGSATVTQTVIVSASTLPCYVPSSGLVAWYPFTSNAVDSSGNGHNGIDSGATLTTDRFGHPNSAYNFNGVDNYIAIDSMSGLPMNNSARSISVWMDPAALAGMWTLTAVAYGNPTTSNAFMFGLGDSLISVQGWVDDFSLPLAYTVNQWINTVCTFDGLNVCTYVNGNLVGCGTISTWNTTGIEFYIGGRVSLGNSFFNGKLDEIGIWNRALTPCEISKLYYASCIIPAGTITGLSNVCVGSTIALADTTIGGVWSSSNTTVATVGSTGVVTGISAGTSIISYLTTNLCGAASATKTISVNPSPVLSSPLAPPAICDSTMFSYAPASATSGISFNWSRATVTGISNSSSAGAGSINEVLVNTTANPIGVTYVFTLTGTGCTNTQNVMVTVNPKPLLTSPLIPAAICSGTIFSYTPGSVTTGVVFTWSRATVAGISNLPASGINSINETLVNTTTAPIAVTYVYTLVANGCLNTQNVIVTVNPPVTVAGIAGASSVCSGSVLSLTEATTGGVWSSTNTIVATTGSAGAVTGAATGTATISYTVTNSCGATAATKTITVNAAPAAITGGMNVCVGNSVMLNDVVSGGTWSSGGTAIATVLSGTSEVTGATPGIAPISYTLVDGCQAAATVTVSAAPGPITGSTEVCSGAITMLNDTSAGGIWSSSNTAIATAGSLSGVVTGVAGGAVAISYIDNGCVATHVVTVNSVPPIMGASNMCAYGPMLPLSDAVTGGVWTSTLATISSSGVLTPYSAGVATATYTLSSGCFATATLTINPLPGPVTGATHFCMGSATGLSDTTFGGTWSSSNTAIASVNMSGLTNGLTAGVATISYTLATGCASAEAVTVETFPLAGVIAGLSSVCPGSTIALTDAAAGGIWSASNTLASVLSGTVSGISAGVDTIKYIISNTCGSATATQTITINPLPAAGTITGPGSVCAGDNVILSDLAGSGVWSASNTLATVLGGTVSGVTGGVDTIQYSVTNSCGIANATKTVTVNVLPYTGAIGGIDSVCKGAIISLTETVTGGAWSADNGNATISSAGVITGVSAGIDTIAYSLTDMCGTAAANFVVTVNPLPVAGTIAGNATVCDGAMDTLTGTPPGGMWSAEHSDITVAGNIVTGVTEGPDTVVYTITNSCGSANAYFPVTVFGTSQCDSMTVSPSLSKGEEVLRVFPNPNQGLFTVVLSANTDEPMHVVITNIVGEKVREFDGVTNKITDIKLNEAATVYFISASTAKGTYVAKVVVKP